MRRCPCQAEQCAPQAPASARPTGIIGAPPACRPCTDVETMLTSGAESEEEDFFCLSAGTPLSNETTFKRPVGSSGFTTTSVGCLYPRALSCDERPFRFMRASSKRACRQIARVSMQPSTDAFVRPPPYSLIMFARPRCGRVHRLSYASNIIICHGTYAQACRQVRHQTPPFSY